MKATSRENLKLKIMTGILVMCLILSSAGWLGDLAYGASTTGTVTATDGLNVRSGPGTSYSVLGTLLYGTTITILGTEQDSSGSDWYKINYNSSTGYISASYVTINNSSSSSSDYTYVYDSDFEAQLTAEGFPESYKTYLRQLHAQYPEWVFVAAQTGLDWNDVIDKEAVVGTSLVTSTAIASWKSMEEGAFDFTTKSYVQYDSGGWVTASRQLIEYYMDPRNFLNSTGIFQFLTHSYDSTTQTSTGLAYILSGTFMSGSFPESGYDTYNDVLMAIGAETGVNPYVLASMIIVEQGSSGTGKSISGTVSGYEGYYNYFNIGAYASGSMDAVTRGLWYASQSGSYSRPWNTIYKSILGGAQYYSANYVQNNKYTLYLKKFNVMNGLSSVGTGQYMTNIQGAASEATELASGYSSMMDTAMTFVIPVYENMPDEACEIPTSTGNNNNFLTSITVDGYDLTPTFSRYTTSYELVVASDATSIEVSAKTSSSSASVAGTGTITLSSTTQDVELVVTAPSGVTRTYTITVSKTGTSSGVTLSGSYTFGTYLTGVDFSTSYSSFMKKITVSDGTVALKNSSGKTITSGTVSTGMSLVVYDSSGNEVNTYTVVIKGDTNGDGKISSADPLLLQKYIVGSTTLSGAYLEAADINGDGKANSLDVLYMQKHIVGSYTITN